MQIMQSITLVQGRCYVAEFTLLQLRLPEDGIGVLEEMLGRRSIKMAETSTYVEPVLHPSIFFDVV